MRYLAPFSIALYSLVVGNSALGTTLFDDHTPLSVILKGPLQKTLSDRASSPEYRTYTLTQNGLAVPIEVKPRGSSRRVVCRFPPLRLRFGNIDPQSSFAGQTTLKLVTHCNRPKKSEQNVIEEFAAYRLLNVLTPMSYRVRLLKLTYVDEAHPGAPHLTRWGFIIENTRAMAARLDGEHIEPKYIRPADLDTRHATVVGLFQYLVGNTDYALNARRPESDCCHNAKLIRLTDRTISVPYDFDQAGLVDAAYAGSNPIYNARNVRTRRFVGLCTTPDNLADVFAHFSAKREEIMETVATLPGMSAVTRQRASKYLNGFFEHLNKTGVARLLKACRD